MSGTAPCAAATSNKVALTVNTVPSIGTQPTDQTACSTPGTASFTVVATGTGLSYQWRLNGSPLSDNANISGSTTATLNLSNLTSANTVVAASGYDCVVSGTAPCAAATSARVALTVNTTPSIGIQPTGQTACSNPGTASFTISATGTSLTYQWRLNGSPLSDNANISGSTTNTLNLSNLTSANTVVAGSGYDCVVTDIGPCSVTSARVALTVNTVPSIGTEPTDQTACSTPGTASFTVVASGTGLTYQWRLNGSPLSDNANISGSTTATLSLSNLTSANTVAAGSGYDCVIGGTAPCTDPISARVALTVNTTPTIGTQPTNQTACSNPGTASFTISASGTNLTYQWRLNGVNLTDGANISGSTTATLNLLNLTSANTVAAGSGYDCVVTDIGPCSVTSDRVALTVNTVPTIGTDPTDQTACSTPGTASFTVVASGTGLTYQWRLNGVNLTDGANISGSTTATLSLSNLTSANTVVAGSGYDCVVSGTAPCAAATSARVALTVNTTPIIGTQPTDQTACSNPGTASFTILATGTNLTYQWRLNGVNLIDDANISGSTTATLNLSNLTSANTVAAGSGYDCVVTDIGPCNITSDRVALTVNTVPSIGTEPTNQTACSTPGTSSFTVVASGTGLTYQWRLNGVNLIDDANISGSTTATLNLSNLTSANSVAAASGYDCVVSGTAPCATITSNRVALTVNTVPSIGTQPTAQTACSNPGTATYTVTATGDGLTYQWRLNGVNLSDGANISGSATATLNLSNLTSANTVAAGAGYDCVVSGTAPCISVTSTRVALTVNTVPSISVQPTDQTVCSDPGTASFSVTASGTALTYQWRLNGVNLSDGLQGDGSTVAGATTAILSLSTLTSANTVAVGTGYDCVVSGTAPCSPFTSNRVALTVNTSPVITAQPTAQTACSDPGTATYTITATGTGLTYEWRLNGVNLTDGANVNGSTTATLSLSNLTLANTVAAGAGYDCIVTAATGPCSVTSTRVALTVNTIPSISVQPVDRTACSNPGTTSFSVTASGTGLTYQWRLNGVNLSNGANVSGATTATLSLSNLTSANTVAAGSGYDCVVSGTAPCAAITSNRVALTVNTVPSIGTQPTAQTVCSNPGTATYTITAAGDGLTYQWRLNGVNLSDGANISGSTTATLNLSNLTSANTVAAGSGYDCVVSGTAPCASVTSTRVALTVNTIPSIGTQPTDQTVCSNPGTASFSVVASGTGLTYQWRLNGVNLSNGVNVSGATTATLTLSNLTGANTVTAVSGYDCVVSGTAPCAAAISNRVALTVNSIPATPGPITGPASVCLNTAGYNYSVTAVPGATSYTWTVPSGWNITNGQGTNQITVTSGSVAGNVTVYASNSCGNTNDSHIININPDNATNNTGYVANAGSKATGDILANLSSGGTERRGFIKFPLSSIPANVTVTAATLTLTQNGTATFSSATNNIRGLGANDPVSVSVSGATLYNNAGSGTLYSATTWNNSGTTVLPLNSSAVTDVNNGVSSPGYITMGLQRGGTAIFTFYGYSGGANAPVLSVTYNMPPSSLAVTLNTPAITPAASATSVCFDAINSQNSSLSYSNPVNTPTTYSIGWSGDANAVAAGFADVTDASLLGTPPIIITVPANAAANTYHGVLTVKNASCTSSNYAFTLTVLAGPAAVTFTLPSTTCGSYTGSGNETVQASYTSPGAGFTLVFQSTAGLVFTNASTGTIDLVHSTPATYQVTSKVTNNSTGCSTTSAPVSITIYALPSATISYTSNSLCLTNGTVNPTKSNLNNVLYGAYSASPAGLSINTNPDNSDANAGQINAATSTAGTYTITYLMQGNSTAHFCSNITTTTVTIYPSPNNSYTVGGSTTVCDGSSVNVTLSGSQTGVTYNLIENGASIVASVPGTGSGLNLSTGALTYANADPILHTYSFTVQAVNDATSCYAYMGNSATITVSQIPTATVTEPTTPTICVGGTYMLQEGEAMANNGTIKWTVQSGHGTISNDDAITPTYNSVQADNNTTVTLLMTVSDAPCPPATATYTINVQGPTANAGAAD